MQSRNGQLVPIPRGTDVCLSGKNRTLVGKVSVHRPLRIEAFIATYVYIVEGINGESVIAYHGEIEAT